MERRVVITGMGTVNPLGDTLEGYYENLIAGKSGIKIYKSLDLSKVECKIGGDMRDYDTSAALETFKEILGDNFKPFRKLFKYATFAARMGMLVALKAWHDAGMFEFAKTKKFDPERVAALVAGNNFNHNYFASMLDQFHIEPEYIDPLAAVESVDNNIPALVAEVLGVHGPSYTIGGACASGNLALRDAFRDIRSGEIDQAMVCGPPFDVCAADIQASVIINSVVVKPEYQLAPEKASRPFDSKRCGFVYSHGAAAFVVESLESAQARGARIYAEVLGVKATANANHLPMPGAQYQAMAMRSAIKQAGISPETIQYANCHATGTPAGDIQELAAMKEVFGAHIYKMKINAPKSMLGHTCWASPIVETIGGIMQMRHGRLHPTINIEELAPEVDVDVCANHAVDFQADYMLKNSFGFGGLNCCSVIKLWRD